MLPLLAHHISFPDLQVKFTFVRQFYGKRLPLAFPAAATESTRYSIP
jgi:hypothetical protein